MALINCPECGKEFSDKAAACPNCACPIVEKTESLYGNNYAIIESEEKLKESGLGIVSLILSIVGMFSGLLGIGMFVASGILGIISINQADRKSICSTIALCIIGLNIVFGFIIAIIS